MYFADHKVNAHIKTWIFGMKSFLFVKTLLIGISDEYEEFRKINTDKKSVVYIDKYKTTTHTEIIIKKINESSFKLLH